MRLGQTAEADLKGLSQEQFEFLREEFRGDVYKILGKGLVAIIGTIVAGICIGLGTWYGLLQRVDRLEIWKQERAVGVDAYNEFRLNLEKRLTNLEAGQNEILRRLPAPK